MIWIETKAIYVKTPPRAECAGRRGYDRVLRTYSLLRHCGGNYAFLNSDLGAPHTGQTQLSGSSSKGTLPLYS